MARTGGTVVEVQVLGHIEAGRDGRNFALGGATQRRVLAALVARRGEVVEISTLIDICWPERDAPRRADHNIRTYVHRLRSAMDGTGDRVETVGSGYRLRLEPTEVDIERFERLGGNASAALSSGDPIAALDALDDAESLWRGRPYGEFADEPWLSGEVVRIGNVRVAMRERRAQALLDLGRAADAVAELELLVRDEPYREHPRALLMRALYESGRPTEALRAFQDFRRVLIDDAGVEPSRDLVELDHQIVSGTLDAGARARTVGNYRLHERIGVGAFASVRRATQLALGRDVAIKIIRAELADRPDFIRRFEAEAQLVAAIEHPHVVPLYDYWREPGTAYLVMRWMSGGSLHDRLGAGALSIDETIAVIDQIASALDAAHEHGVVHRDVKPANILFDQRACAYLGDFGIALATELAPERDATRADSSPLFASPEQLRHEPATPACDVHALGMVAFTALTGRPPFHDAADDAERLRRQLHDPIPSALSFEPTIPVAVDDALAVATSKRPRDRFPTASSFAAALRRAAGGDATRSPPTAARTNPYRGLRPFTEAESANFFGRTGLVAELEAAVADPDRRFVAVIGPSGSGKSSVVRAGLVPTMRVGRHGDSDQWFITTMTPGSHPFESLEAALLRVAANPPVSLLDQLRDGDRGINRATSRLVPSAESTVLVVIDQFEELFTSTGADERDHFLRALTCAVTEPEGSLRVVATMRADFCDDALGHPAFAAPFKAGLVPIAPLSPDELETAITAPAAAVGVTFEPGLVAEIVAEVSGRPGALPLLQYSLRQAFDATDGETVTVDCYREVGGLTGALSRSAELAFSESSEDERIAMRRLFGRLVALGDGNDDTRRRVRRHELPADAALDAVIERLGVMRLLTFDHDPATRAPTVEVAHEAVLRVWMRLRRWLDEDRARLRTHRHLSEAATAWNDRERDPTELYRGGRLDAAEELVEVDSAALNEIETDFLRASLRQRDEQRDREQRRVRRLRRIVVATTATTVVAMLATVVAVLQWTRAEHESERAVANEQEAIERTAEATAQRLAVQSVQAQALDPDLAINLALESIRRTDEAGLPPVDGAVSALHDATQSSRLVARFETTGPAAMDEGGDAIALMRPGGELVVVDAVTQEVEQRAPIAGDVEEIRFVPGGSRILVLTRQETVLLDRGDMSPVAVVQVPCCRSSGEIEFDATGQQVAIGIEGDTSGTTLVLDSTDLDEVAQLDAVSPAGWLGGELIVFDSENVEAVDPLTDARRHLLDVDAPGSVDMDAQGTRLAITGSGRVSLWQFRGQSVTHVNDLDIDFGSGLGRGAHFTADGRHVLVIKDPIEVVPVEAVPDDPGGRLLLPGHGAIWDWATTELGDRLLASSVGEALLWDLAPAGPADLGAIDVIGNVWEIEWSDDGSVMYVADSTGDEARVRAIDISSLSTIATVDGFAPTEGAGPVVGRTGLVAGHRGDDERGVVVDVRTGEAVAALEPCFEPYSIDDAGRWMIVVCEDDAEGGSYVVDPATGEELSDLGPAGGFSAIGPPGTRSDGLAVYQTPDGLALRDLRTGAEFGPFAGQLFPWRPFFSADGRFVTAGSAHGGGIVLDVAEIVEGATGDDPLVRNPRPGAGGTTFSIVAGDYFVTGHDGEILRFWGPSDERPEFDLDVRSRDTTFLATSPDARYLYYEAEGDVLRRFPLALTDLVAAGEARARRGFTVDECERFSLAGDCGLFIESQ